MPVVFTPENEPYLGRKSVHQFDQIILSCLKANEEVAAYTRTHMLSSLQHAASQIIPQGINLALSIRELVRQGYLFGAAVLLRPLIERAATISFLAETPEKVPLWEAGWKPEKHGGKGRPTLGEMMAKMSGGKVDQQKAQDICAMFNHLDHGDPAGAEFNLVKLSDSSFGYAVSKSLSDPEFCDFICTHAYLYLIVLMGRMTQCFPGVHGPEKTIH